MIQRSLRRCVPPALLLLTVLSCGRPAPRWNLLILTLDTTRADRFGFAGHPRASTPNFDAFVARRAIHFAQTVTAVPLTFPSHTTILSGTYPVFHGIHDNDGFYLDDGVETLAEILGAEGFTTAAFVAAFPLDSRFNLDQGFGLYNDDFQQDWTEAEVRARSPLSFGFAERKADLVNRAAFRWLEDHWQERFFLWMHYFDPHQPYNAPAPYDSQFAASPYDGEIAFVDEQFGRLLELLESKGLHENTVIAVVGDHGEALGEHGEPTHAAFLYDATMRVPWLVATPDGLGAGRRVETQARTLDVAPTLLDLLGLPPGPQMQGRSLVPLLTGEAGPGDSEALLEAHFTQYHHHWAPLRALRTDRFKYVLAPRPELYDLEEDPGELYNLAAQRGELVAELENRLLRLARRVSSPEAARSAAAGVDAETQEKLLALGYISGGGESQRRRPFPTPAELAEMVNPVDRALVLQHANFANEMLRQQRFGEAVSVARKGLEVDPRNPRLQYIVGASHAAMGNSETALTELRQAAELMPDWALPHHVSGRVLLRIGEVSAAVDELEVAAEIEPTNASVLETLAGALLLAGRDGAAIVTFERLLEIDDSSWTSHVDLANAFARQGRWQEARAGFQRALELNPYSPAVHFQIGLLYRRADNPEFSRQMFESTARLAPENPAPHMELAELHFAAGDHAAARRSLDRLLELAPQAVASDRVRILQQQLQ